MERDSPTKSQEICSIHHGYQRIQAGHAAQKPLPIVLADEGGGYRHGLRDASAFDNLAGLGCGA